MAQLVELDPVLVKPLRPEPAPRREAPAPRPRPVPAESSASPAELDPVLVNRLRRPEKAPRKRTPVSLQARPRVLRAAFILVAGTICFTFAGRFAAFAMAPVMATYRTGQEIRQLQQVLATETAANDRLRADIAYLRTPEGVEQEARRRGWVRPGEVALSVVVPASTETQAEPVRPAAERPSVSERIQTAVETCLAVLGGGPRKP